MCCGSWVKAVSWFPTGQTTKPPAALIAASAALAARAASSAHAASDSSNQLDLIGNRWRKIRGYARLMLTAASGATAVSR